jgi:hypothetical protein
VVRGPASALSSLGTVERPDGSSRPARPLSHSLCPGYGETGHAAVPRGSNCCGMKASPLPPHLFWAVRSRTAPNSNTAGASYRLSSTGPPPRCRVPTHGGRLAADIRQGWEACPLSVP